MTFQTLHIGTTIPPTQIIEAGNGSVLVANTDLSNILYLSDSDGFNPSNLNQTIPLGPNGYIVFDGSIDVYALAVGNPIITLIVPTASSFFSLIDRLIIQGSGAFTGLFVYDTAPPSYGSLIASIAAMSGNDPYGNFYQAGITSYLGSSGWAQLLAGALFLNDDLNTKWYASAFVDEVSPTDFVPYIAIGNETVGENLLFISDNGFITPAQPGTLGEMPESWHLLSLTSGWTSVNGPYYRLTCDNKVEVYGSVTHASFSSSTQLSATGALGSGYQPKSTWNGGGPGIPGRAGWEVTTAGTIIANPGSSTCTECDLAGAFPLGL
jgi:hypothetical protein